MDSGIDDDNVRYVAAATINRTTTFTPCQSLMNCTAQAMTLRYCTWLIALAVYSLLSTVYCLFLLMLLHCRRHSYCNTATRALHSPKHYFRAA